MSKLTNYQIQSMVHGLKSGVAAARARGDRIGVLRRQVLIAKYEGELREREAAASDPGTEIQTVRHGEA